MDTMFDNLSLLPQWMQFILILFSVGGSAGGIFGMVFAYLKDKEMTLQKQIAVEAANKAAKAQERIEQLENAQLKIQFDADQRKAEMDLLSRIVENAAKNDLKWQTVIDAKSERDRETQVKIAEALENNQGAITNLSSVLEVLSAHHMSLIGEVQKTEKQSRQAVAIVEAQTQQTKTSVDSIKEALDGYFDLIKQTLDKLITRLDDMTDTQNTHIESQSERHDKTNQELVDMRQAIQTMNTVISNIHKLVNEMNINIETPNEERPAA